MICHGVLMVRSEDSSEPERDALVRGNGVGFFGVHCQLGGVIGAAGVLAFDDVNVDP